MRVRWMLVPLLLVAVSVTACKDLEESSEEATYEPATLRSVDGSDAPAVVLTEDAAARIDLQTTPVSTASPLLVVPYAAVFYGLTGETWVYAETQPLTFVRTPVTVDSVSGSTAYLSDGPTPGTDVVTVGAAELFGVETGIGT